MTRTASSMRNANKFKFGIFSPNCSGGLAVTTVPERWDASWANNLKLAQICDETGIEFILPIARWKGYGGATNFQGTSLETVNWACGLLAQTRNVTVFGTVHANLIHPVFAAKEYATVDLISSGRFGVNIVCGWNQDDFDMFGLQQLPHDERYVYAQEWWDLITRIWGSDAPFDSAGKYFTVRNVIGDPKPFGGTRPITMNAGSSAAGRNFAARNCDFLFTVLADPEKGAKDVAAIKSLAQGEGREIDVFTTSYAVCRPTRKEAQEYHEYYANERADWPAVDKLMTELGLHSQSFAPEHFQAFRNRFAAGHGCYPLIGTPDDIAAEIKKISDAGFVGTTLGFVNYVDELPYFAAEVLPRLERMGLREKVGAA